VDAHPFDVAEIRQEPPGVALHRTYPLRSPSKNLMCGVHSIIGP
jgi:hypothetical protein